MIALLLLLLLSAPARAQEVVDTDTPVSDDTDAPLTDVDAPLTDVEAPAEDTDLPALDEGPAPRLTWPGMDAFIGPILPDEASPTDDEDPPETPATDEAHTDEAHTDEAHTDEAHTDEAHTDPTTDDTDGPSGSVDEADPQDTDIVAAAAPESPSDGVPADAATSPSPVWLPSLPLRGWRVAIGLTLVTLLCWGCARALGPARDWLAPTGVLPTLAGGLQQVLRVLSLFFAFGVIAAIVPANLEPALPWVVLAGAVALGWSTRDVAPDFIAGLVLAAERRIGPGKWIGTSGVSGVVEQVGMRVTWVRDATGRRVALPNRVFLTGSVVTDRGQWPSIEVVIRVPGEHTPSAIRRVLEDAVLVSPWTAPLPPEMVREEQEIGLWRVRARVLEGRFIDRFEGALREHVEESLQVGSGLRDRLGSTRPRAREASDDPTDAP